MAMDELSWQFLTGVVSDIKSPNRFLTRLLMTTEQTLPVGTVRIETISKGREIAPFVRKNGEAIMVKSYNGAGYSVEAPNIRIKIPMATDNILFNRQPGQGAILNPTEGDVANAYDQAVARDAEVLENMVVNGEEWLTAMMLQGQITYAQEDEEVFQITYPKPSANNITLSVFLDDGTPANVRYLAAINTAKQVVADDGSPALTDIIYGSEASVALMSLAEGGFLKWANTQTGNPISVGTISFVEQFSDDGVIFLGEFAGLRHWSYNRTASLNGTTTSMIRPKYAEFVSTSPATRRVMYYGAITDLDAFKNRLFQSKRFSKSWSIPDPSAQMLLVHSRPLPVPRRPGASVSMKVVSG